MRSRNPDSRDKIIQWVCHVVAGMQFLVAVGLGIAGNVPVALGHGALGISLVALGLAIMQGRSIRNIVQVSQSHSDVIVRHERKISELPDRW